MKNKLITVLAILGLVSLIQSCGNVEDKKTSTQTASPVSETSEISSKPESVAPQIQYDQTKAKRLTDTAKLLAGMKVDDSSELAKIQTMDIWQNHRNTLEKSWSQLDKQQLSKVREWSNQELQAINGHSPTIFYPFSGPDFLYAYSLFPQGKEYVMIGLEPVGTVPDISDVNTGQLNQKLTEARNSLYALLQFSFFRTNDMKVDLAKQGVLPVIFLFMARTNNQILNVEFVGIDKQANIQKMADGMIPGVKIDFLPDGETTPKTLYYFSTDLSNDGLKKNPQLTEFVKKLIPLSPI